MPVSISRMIRPLAFVFVGMLLFGPTVAALAQGTQQVRSGQAASGVATGVGPLNQPVGTAASRRHQNRHQHHQRHRQGPALTNPGQNPFGQ
jgi:hypothetical protein